MTIEKRAIIWDMDGVLVDSGDLHYRSWREIAADEFGIDLAREEFDRFFGTDNAGALRELMGREPTPAEIERIGGRQAAHYRALAVEEVEAVPGAFDLVRACASAGWAQAVATSAPRATLELILDKFGLGEWFAATVSTDDVPRAKPDPALFVLAAARLAVPAERCIVIEDSLNGIRAAQAAGMLCIGLTTTHGMHALDGADRVIHALSDLTPDDLAAMLGDV